MTFKKTAETLRQGAHTLSREYYIDPKTLELEYEKIFFKNWLCVGRSAQISEKGRYIILNIGIESVIILRDSEGELKGFYNVCRHRGTRICEKMEGKFSKSIQCGYHGWTYDLKGNLIGVPNMDAVTGFKKDEYPLHPVALKEWEGFIFINLEDKPINFDSTFEPLTERLNPWGISELLIAEKKEYMVNGNWKLVIQNYCECYHCPILHPELAKIHHYLGGRNDFYEGPILGGYMDFNEDKGSITSSGELCCLPLDGVKDGDLNRVYYYSIFPNMLLSLHPEYIMYHTVVPISLDKCKVTCSWLFEKDVVESGKFNTKDAVDFWDMTNNQDWKISELSQLGIQSSKYSPAPYSGQESLLAAFDKYYLNQINKY